MEIKKCCSNCALENMKEFCSCKYDIEYPVEETDMFIPKEELVRKDEREKIITDLENEIQNFNEVRDSKTIDFINDFIRELKEK